MPWYAVYGNHDTLLLGTFGLSSQLRSLAVGGRKSFTLDATETTALTGYAATGSVLQRGLDAFGQQHGHRSGLRDVASRCRPASCSSSAASWPSTSTRPTPGPIGHGFTQHNLDSGETWWQADLSPHVRAFGLDTCNQVAGADGAVPDDQFRWLTTELAAGPGRAAPRPDLQPPQQPHAGEPGQPARASTNRCTAPRSSSTCCCASRSSSGGSTATPTSTRSSPTPGRRAASGRSPRRRASTSRSSNRSSSWSTTATGRCRCSRRCSTTPRRSRPAPAAATSTWHRRAASWRPTTGPSHR